jgi:two-component system sensor histidine kinase ChiS
MLRRQHREIRAAERANLVREERARAQELAMESLRKADRLKDEFLANISHELRTPLNAIIGFSAILKKRVGDHLDARSSKFLDTVHAAGEELLIIINDIIDVSMLARGELELQLEPIDTRVVTDMVVERLQPMAVAKEIELVNGVGSDLPKVLADESRVLQVLTKLVDNAIKFSESGPVEVTGQVVDIADEKATDPSRSRQALAITVSDSGIGISSEDLGEIFNPFEQADGSWSRQYEGAGLGLSITRKLVELHCGTISVESQVGAGSRFTFTLPLA